jgi:hypothetical protein
MNGTITREQLERVTVRVPNAEQDSAVQWLEARGYSNITMSPVKIEHGSWDLSRRDISGERKRTGSVEMWTKQVVR